MILPTNSTFSTVSTPLLSVTITDDRRLTDQRSGTAVIKSLTALLDSVIARPSRQSPAKIKLCTRYTLAQDAHGYKIQFEALADAGELLFDLTPELGDAYQRAVITMFKIQSCFDQALQEAEIHGFVASYQVNSDLAVAAAFDPQIGVIQIQSTEYQEIYELTEKAHRKFSDSLHAAHPSSDGAPIVIHVSDVPVDIPRRPKTSADLPEMLEPGSEINLIGIVDKQGCRDGTFLIWPDSAIDGKKDVIVVKYSDEFRQTVYAKWGQRANTVLQVTSSEKGKCHFNLLSMHLVQDDLEGL